MGCGGFGGFVGARPAPGKWKVASSGSRTSQGGSHFLPMFSRTATFHPIIPPLGSAGSSFRFDGSTWHSSLPHTPTLNPPLSAVPRPKVVSELICTCTGQRVACQPLEDGGACGLWHAWLPKGRTRTVAALSKSADAGGWPCRRALSDVPYASAPDSPWVASLAVLSMRRRPCRRRRWVVEWF